MLERRLRLGIGGYLSSRGLPLRDLDSASLTAPDDDPAMGQIWDSLIGPDDAVPTTAADRRRGLVAARRLSYGRRITTV